MKDEDSDADLLKELEEICGHRINENESNSEESLVHDSLLEGIILSPIGDKSMEEESKYVSPLSEEEAVKYGRLAESFPIELLRAYWEKFELKEIFVWQTECLNNKLVKDGKNFIFSAPTSAGKSLVADLLLLRPLVEHRLKADLTQENEDVEKPIAIYVVPQISLITEKEQKISDLLVPLNLTMQAMHSHKRAILSESSPPDLVLCTMEKANQLITRLLACNQIHKVRTIVIDELHLIGDESRGYILELLLTKALYINQKFSNVNL